MQNILGLAWSMAYIVLVLIVATLVAKFSRGASESSRKLVHILVGNWVFLIPLFTDLWAVVLVPFTFIIVNSLSLKYRLIAAMERSDGSLGTVYYAISMFVLSGAAFVLKWPVLAYTGLLTMAYGDGLAAIIGGRWAKARPFAFAPQRSLAGSLTVAVVAFVVTALSLFILEDGAPSAVLTVLLIALLNAVLSAFIELTGKRGSDNLSLPVGSGLFAVLAWRFGSPGLLLYLLLAVLILAIAFKAHAITPDGIVAALLTALTLYTLGDVWIATALLLFFILGSGVSKLKNDSKRLAETIQEGDGPRNWKQVLCNSLPAVALVWMHYFLPGQRFLLLLALGVFSAAAADTFASELGMLSRGRVFNILTGKTVPNGLSGGVSVPGLFAGLLGSSLLSLLAWPGFGLPGVLFLTGMGLLGSLLDSILGAALQRKYRNTDGQLQDKAAAPADRPAAGFPFISNNTVNLISLSLLVLCGNIFCYLIAIPY